MNDRLMMTRALHLAVRGAGNVAPNPIVGCVIAKDGKILGEGWHRQFGGPHAEREALAAAKDADVRGATCFVTLEPCSHTGKTPPCTDALIEAGIARVVIAAKDPNPKARGGAEKLLQAGLKVDIGLMREEAEKINEAFFHQLKTGRPYIRWKVAATADGCVAPPPGSTDRKISASDADDWVQNLRHSVGAIMVGAGTVRKDNPLLSDRSGLTPKAPLLRVIVGHDPMVLEGSRILETAGDIPTVFACSGPATGRECLQKAGIDLWHWPDHKDVPLNALCDRLAARGINDVLLEGGAHLAAAMLQAQLIDRVHILWAPKLLGTRSISQAMLADCKCSGPSDAYRLVKPDLTFLGDDVLYSAAVAYDKEGLCLPD